MSARGEIGLGDLIRVAGVLAPDDETARRIARLLGVGAEAVADEEEDAAGRRHEPAKVETTASITAPFAKLDEPELVTSAAAGDETVLLSRGRRADRLVTYDDAPSLPPPSRPAPRSALLPARLALFQPRWTRSLLGAALATERDEGEVDVDALVDILARRASLRELPRRPTRTLRLGAQLFVDRGDGMLPFRRDVAQILARLERLLVGALETHAFDGDPRRVIAPQPTGSVPAPLPRPGTPVIAIGDLGAGDPWRSSVAAWVAWAARVRQHGCPLVVVTPLARARWPPALARLATLVFWDRSTRSSAVHRARARRRGR